MNGPHLGQISLRHLLDRLLLRWLAGDDLRLQSIDGALIVDVAGELLQIQDPPSTAVDTEERVLAARRSDGNDAAGGDGVTGRDELGLGANGARTQQRCGGKIDTELAVDVGGQLVRLD